MAYLAILGRPGILPLVASAIVARLPVGLNGIAIVLYVQAEQGSFAIAGAVISAMAIGNAVGGPLQSRLMDRCGIWPLIGFGLGHAAALGAIVLVCAGSSPLPLQVLVGFLTGVSLPVTTSVLRARWRYILVDRTELLTPAFALDSVLIEVAFVGGPLIAGAALAISGPIAAIAISAACSVAGTTAFTVALIRQPGPVSSQTRHESILGPLASSGVRLLTVISVPLGFYLGVVEIVLPAFAHDIGRQPLAGVLLAFFAAASTIGVLIYGVMSSRRSLWQRHLRFTALLAVAGLPMIFAAGPLSALVFITFAGFPVAPVIASRNELVRHVAPPGTEAEAFAWPLTAMIVGISLGALIGGLLIGSYGWRAPLIAGSAVTAAAALLSVLVRPTAELLGDGARAAR